MMRRSSNWKNRKLIAVTDQQIYVGEGKRLSSSIFGTSERILDTNESAVLASYSLPLSPKEALSRLRGSPISVVSRKDYYQITKRLIESDLLLPLDQFTDRLEESTHQAKASITSTLQGGTDAPEAPDNFCWVTADRPEAIASHLSSFTTNFQEHDRNPVLRIFNDSKNHASDRRYYEYLGELAASYPGEVRYCAPEDRYRFALLLKKTLHDDGITPSVIDFLFGIGYENLMTVGANRNTVLLDTINERIVCCDDDVYCRLSDSGTATRNIRVKRCHDPFNVSYFKSRGHCIENTQETEADFLHLHAGLGSKFYELIKDGAPPRSLNLDEVDSSLLSLLVSPAASIYLTATGHYGDAAFSGNTPLLNIHGYERSKLMTDKERYESYLQFFGIKCDVDHLYISSGSSFFGNCFGLDNRDILLPFFPFGRNEESIFSRALSFTNPLLLPSYIPFSVLHKGRQEKTYGRKDLFTVIPEISSFILFFISEYKSPGSTSIIDGTNSYLHDIGRHLYGIASLSKKSFIEYASHALRTLLGSNIFYYKGLLFHYGNTPDYWARDLSELITKTEDVFFNNDLPLPLELRTIDDPDTAMDYFRHCIKSYGELILSWPVVRTAAFDLQLEGSRLSTMISSGTKS